ncbi:cell wall elongation regulator TseB-like domain-containing protein [Piscibacillus salipiscarius]|uniref:cell wall elongation regulator TseB-like domain-containing protein n=1 Tax=Piscibacillus salipiscarius TaxID=299480 RepID=UPI0024372480|nr:DUF5590 domain-containing protein [Piscibacillus salipiscarius]
MDQAKSKAIKDTPLTKVESASLFNGRNSFVSIKGKDEESKPLFAFIPQLNQKQNESDQKQPETHYVYADQGFTKDEIIKQWGSNCQNCDLDEVTIGMLNNRVVWEIIYERDNRLIFQTYRFDTGELYDSISFNQ